MSISLYYFVGVFTKVQRSSLQNLAYMTFKPLTIVPETFESGFYGECIFKPECR